MLGAKRRGNKLTTYNLAPGAGFEPAISALTVRRCTTQLPRNSAPLNKRSFSQRLTRHLFRLGRRAGAVYRLFLITYFSNIFNGANKKTGCFLQPVFKVVFKFFLKFIYNNRKPVAQSVIIIVIISDVNKISHIVFIIYKK